MQKADYFMGLVLGICLGILIALIAVNLSLVLFR